jgi:flavin-binding protein dodecin
MSDDIPGAVVKVIEIVGSSSTSFSDAVRNAVKTASRTIRQIQGVDVLSSSAEVGEDGEITTYKVQCKLAFVIEHSADSEGEGVSGAAQASTAGVAAARGASPGAHA